MGATFFTYKNIQTLKKKNRVTGERLGGTYFCATGMILIDRLDREDIRRVLEELDACGEIGVFCEPCAS